MVLELAEELLDAFGCLLPDTTPERIRCNRASLCVFYNKMRRASRTIPRPIPDEVKEAVRLFNEYYHYFDKGYHSSENIDSLPDKLKEALGDVIALYEEV